MLLRRPNPPMTPMFTDGFSVPFGVNRWMGGTNGYLSWAQRAAPLQDNQATK